MNSDDTLKKYMKLQKSVTEAQVSASRAEGALSQLMVGLKDKFGCDTLKQAKKKLKSLQSQEETSREEFEEAVEAFEEKWQEHLQETEEE